MNSGSDSLIWECARALSLLLRRMYAHLVQAFLHGVYFCANGSEWIAAQFLRQRSGNDSGSQKKMNETSSG